jgi:hypothetical protein
MTPWHQRSEEPGKCFDAFSYYLHLGPSRTIDEAWRRAVRDRSAQGNELQWRQWYDYWDWNVRAQVFDDYCRRCTVPQRLSEYWMGYAPLTPNAGATQAQIDALENKHRVRLPKSVRAMYEFANGYEGFDRWCTLTFWALERIAPSIEPGFFVFADFLIDSWHYAVRLAMDADVSTAVVISDGCVHKPLAESFEEFIEMYVTGNPEILTRA